MRKSEDLPGAAEAVLERFAQRVAARDVPEPVLMTPAAVQQRLGEALAAQLGSRDPRRQQTLGRLLYALMAEPWLTNAQLAAAMGRSVAGAQRVADELARAGLVEVRYVAARRRRVRQQRLSRAGEDWVLPRAQGVG
ncbi:MarR family transcriptional regulator [Hymenobacter sp. B81]|uniref:MarR family transcriptional regulator n=1 Tax=Hymenobacter sp. B81 TaxID=3344878 RepID=UPI0037DCFC1E